MPVILTGILLCDARLHLVERKQLIMIHYSFDEEKATQVATEFLSRAPLGELDDVVLMKLMYFADRESLELFDQPIIGDRLYCMENGPILSRVLTLFNATHGRFSKHSPVDVEKSVFLRYIQRNDGKVSMVRQPDLKKLSRAEKAIIERVSVKYGNMTRGQIVDVAHELCEYIDTAPNQRKSLRYEDVLKSIGRSAQEIDVSQKRAAISTRIRNLASKAREAANVDAQNRGAKADRRS